MRKEFPAKVKLAAWERAGGKCEQCHGRIVGRPEYDHVKPDGLGGEPILNNCQVLCSSCHRIKTHEHDRPIMTKADRQRKSAAGIKRKHKWPKRPFGGWQRPSREERTEDT